MLRKTEKLIAGRMDRVGDPFKRRQGNKSFGFVQNVVFHTLDGQEIPMEVTASDLQALTTRLYRLGDAVTRLEMVINR